MVDEKMCPFGLPFFWIEWTQILGDSFTCEWFVILNLFSNWDEVEKVAVDWAVMGSTLI